MVWLSMGASGLGLATIAFDEKFPALSPVVVVVSVAIFFRSIHAANIPEFACNFYIEEIRPSTHISPESDSAFSPDVSANLEITIKKPENSEITNIKAGCKQ